MVEFSKYEINNKLLGGIILIRVTLSVTGTHIYIIFDLLLVLF